MARRGGRRGSRGRSSSRRSRGRTGGVGSSRSKSKSNRSKSKSTGGSRGRSSNTRGGQSKANRNQNKKARRTVKSVKKAASRAAKGIGNVAKHIGRGAVSYAANHPGLSSYNKRTRDMSKLSPQSRRRYERLSAKTGRDYSQRIPSMNINLSADALARLGKFQDSGWYKGLTNRFPGIRNLQINKQLYSNPERRGWHSSQRTGRGQGLNDIVAGGIPRPIRGQTRLTDKQRVLSERIARTSHPEFVHSRREAAGLPSLRTTIDRSLFPDTDASRGQYTAGQPIRGIPGRPPRGGPERDWLSELYSTHNISGGKLDEEARNYWSKEAKTKGRDAVMQSIIGTSKAQGTYGGRRKPQRIDTGRPPNPRTLPWFGRGPKTGKPNRRSRPSPRVGHWGIGIPGHAGRFLGVHVDRKGAKRSQDLQNKGAKRRMNKSIAAFMAARGGIG